MIVFEWFHKMYRVISAEMTEVNGHNASEV